MSSSGKKRDRALKSNLVAYIDNFRLMTETQRERMCVALEDPNVDVLMDGKIFDVRTGRG